MIPGDAHEHLTEFAGAPVVALPDYDVDIAEDWPGRAIPEDAEAWAWRVGCPGWGGPDFDVWWELFRRDVDASRISRLILGNWVTDWDPNRPASEWFGLLLRDKEAFPALTALFVGDSERYDCDISDIPQADLTPLLEAFPALEILGARGGQGVGLAPTRHTSLRELTFQSGGLPSEAVQQIGACDFPALTDLELYLGTERYGGGATAGDLAAVLSGARLPSLRYLGLRDAENADEVAAALAHAPVVAQLEVLDLSLGSLSDAGAAALLAGQPLDHLRKLDLHHHFISEPMRERLRQAWPGVEIDLGDPQEEDTWTQPDGTRVVHRYIAVSE